MYDIPQDIYAQVEPVAKGYGVPTYIWAAIAKMETNFNPKALGDNGKSFGMFQLYTNGGQGDPYKNNPTVLFNPKLNAEVAMPSIARAYKNGKSMGYQDGPELASFVAGHSGHPTNAGATNEVAKRAINRVYENAKAFLGIKGNSDSSNGTQGENMGVGDTAKGYVEEGINNYVNDKVDGILSKVDFKKLFQYSLILILGVFFIMLGSKLVTNSD